MPTSGAGGIPPQGPKKPVDLNKLKPLQNPKTVPEQPLSASGDHKFAGMDFSQKQWAKFLSILMNQAMAQMKRDNARMMKAIKKFRHQ